MVPAPTYQNLPTFGTGASLVQPIAGTYNGGFLPGQLFPAEYENWLMNYITANSNTSQTSVINLVAEMGTILAAASITPNAGQTNQLYAALNALYLTLSGGTMTGAINMGSHKITSLTDPTSAQDAVTQSYALGLVNGNNHGLVTLISGTSWTVPAGVTRVMVTTIGGGGGGGDGKNGAGSGGGGGSGGLQRSYVSVVPGASISYSIGAGGTAGTGGTGAFAGTGGTTTFTGATSAAGGQGGQGGNGSAGAGGIGGQGLIPGSSGVNGFSSTTGIGGPGGGNGGSGGFNTAGNPGSQPGGGGGGGGSSGNNNGGVGGAGQITIEY